MQVGFYIFEPKSARYTRGREAHTSGSQPIRGYSIPMRHQHRAGADPCTHRHPLTWLPPATQRVYRARSERRSDALRTAVMSSGAWEERVSVLPAATGRADARTRGGASRGGSERASLRPARAGACAIGEAEPRRHHALRAGRRCQRRSRSCQRSGSSA